MTKEVTNMEKELLTAREVQQILGLGLSKVYDMMARGELPTLRVGRLIRVPRQALDEWMDARTVPARDRQAAA